MPHIRPATKGDIPELAQLYDALHDHLAAHVNYPGWVKGVYPTQAEARSDIAEGTDFIAWFDGRIVGSIVLNHLPEQRPTRGAWQAEAADDEVLAVHRLAVRPDCQRRGVAAALLRFAEEYAREKGVKALRLDVFRGNAAAISLYEKHGYHYIDWVDLGLAHWGLDRFLLYEKPVRGR